MADEVDFTSLTPYNYSFNNPIRYNDPYGDFPIIIPLIAGITAGEAAVGASVAAVGAAVLVFGDKLLEKTGDLLRAGAGGNLETMHNPSGNVPRWDLVLTEGQGKGQSQSTSQSNSNSKGKNGGTFGAQEDTQNSSSNQALGNAKEQNGIPKSQQPDRTIKPNTEEG